MTREGSQPGDDHNRVHPEVGGTPPAGVWGDRRWER
jgi:hypothetical protein